jgi:hypothetical protein
MARLILVLCAAGLLTGCGKAPTDAGKKGDGGTNTRYTKGGSGALQAAEDFIAVSWKGSDYEILSTKEQPTTLRKQPAVAVHIQWKIKGEGEQKTYLALVQEEKVKYFEPADTSKSFEENVAAAVKFLESP